MRRHRRPRFVFAILVVAALTGCAETPAIKASAPVMPAAPTNFGKPVAVRAPKVGEDARVYAARERAARFTANRRLTDDAAFYAGVVTAVGAR